MIDGKTLKARQFVAAVQALAGKYELPFFVVTDGASGISDNGCDAVAYARRAHVEWERTHGIDPDHNWSEGENPID